MTGEHQYRTQKENNKDTEKPNYYRPKDSLRDIQKAMNMKQARIVKAK